MFHEVLSDLAKFVMVYDSSSDLTDINEICDISRFLAKFAEICDISRFFEREAPSQFSKFRKISFLGRENRVRLIVCRFLRKFMMVCSV